jgi:hypothetical protein
VFIDPCPWDGGYLREVDKPGNATHIVTASWVCRIHSDGASIAGGGSPPWFAFLNFPHAPVECTLPLVNLTDNCGISDPNHAPHFSPRIYVAPCFTQTMGISFVGHNEKTAGGITPKLDGQTSQNRLERSVFLFHWRNFAGERSGKRRLDKIIDGLFDVQLITPPHLVTG